ncbi:hypothetical protein [Spirosoma areae]
MTPKYCRYLPLCLHELLLPLIFLLSQLGFSQSANSLAATADTAWKLVWSRKT